jgi:hypothetical protein
VVAFYLPQYHRVAENDAWWGDGFTDWRNVTSARPLYPGHALPSPPGELGEYDLLSRETRAAQAALAREYGVYGFCYYFYWFGGRRLLERPLELMLEDGQPDLPFALCWANEPWTRRWDGREQDVLMPQHHDRVRDLAILDDLMPYFEDPRYIRIDDRPLLLVYRQGLMPDAPGLAADLRAEAVRRGLPGLFLCNVLSIGDIERCAPGFDAAVEFPPHGTIGKEIRARDLGADRAFRGHIYDYASTVMSAVARPNPWFPCFPGVMPRWDNTARKGPRAHIFHGSTPALFERWLRRASLDTSRRNPGAPLLFVNSWNEWAEGAHLEPDERVGRGYLEVVRRVMAASAGSREAASLGSGQVPDAIGPHASPLDPTGLSRVTRLLPGLPAGTAQWTNADGAAWIDEVDGRPFEGSVIPVAFDKGIRLRGWFYGDPRSAGRAGKGAQVILSSAEASWYAPLTDRYRRTDVLRGKLATNQRRRKLVRVLDRLPSAVGSLGLSLLGGRHDRFGFEIVLGPGELPQGTWTIGFASLTPSGFVAVATSFALRV